MITCETRRRYAIRGAGVLLSLLATSTTLVVGNASSVAAAVTTLTPVADTYVDSSTPAVSYGTNARLMADASPVREVLLRFDLSSVQGTVQSARLRIHVSSVANSQSPSGGSVAVVSNINWSEATTSYSNRPTGWGAAVVSLGTVRRNTWVDVSVPPAVIAGGAVTLGIRSTHTDGAAYDSRETGATAPQLVVTTGTTTPALNAVDAACAGQIIAANEGTLTDTALAEPSGVDVGLRNPGTYWVHNDSGDSPRVFAVGPTGATQRRYTLSGATHTDWEDIAVGPGPSAGASYLYVADIGDNNAVRPDISVYRVAEPQVSSGAAATLTGVARLRLRYPDGAHNAESLLVDPVTGALTIIAKNPNGGTANVYSAPGGLAGGSTTVLTLVATLSLPAGNRNIVTGADVSSDGTQVAVRTYAAVLLWDRNPANPIWSVFSAAPCTGPVPSEVKGEAIAFHADGRGYVTVNEGTSSVLHGHRSPP